MTLGPAETERQQDQLAGQLELGPRDRVEPEPPSLEGGRDLHPAQGGDRAGPVVDQLGGRDGEQAPAPLLVGGRAAQDDRPGRPGVVGRPGRRRLGQDLELDHRRRALAVGGAQAVGPGVATTNDDDLLAPGIDRRGGEGSLSDQVGRLQVLHREVDPGELTARDLQVSGHRGPARQDQRVELLPQGPGRDHLDVGGIGGAQAAGKSRFERALGHLGRRDADQGGAAEADPLGHQLGQTAVEHSLLHLELGDAVAQEAAGLLGPLEHHHLVAGPSQLLRTGQAGRARAHDGHFLAGPFPGQLAGHPALGPGSLGDLVLDPFDGHRLGVDPEHARGLARCRAEPARELREVVGRVQPLDGGGPVVPPDQVVPLGDQVPERAPLVAERDPAVHAPPGLATGPLGLEGLVDLVPVPDAHRHRPAPGQLAAPLQEPGRLTHGPPPSPPPPPRSPRPRLGRWPRAPAGSPAA